MSNEKPIVLFTVIQALATRGVPCTSAHSKSASSFIRVKYLIVLCCSVSDSDACSRSQAPGGCCKSPPEGSPAHEAFLHVELPNTKDYQGKMGEWVDKCWEDLNAGLTLLGIL
ncbi:hypothetical protein TrRE_jg6229 [Triparma retinervis]|uniref:Uncharacterized protein n=1 Tax=Triparma retinervis TaxID=2557542 RepID=A0A9W7ARZ3_9STRA|nr:hypothetical protein TrRE_jg6229 [Triparma retinervis]